MDPFFEGDEEVFYCSLCGRPTSADYELCLGCYYKLLIQEDEENEGDE